MKTRKLAWYLRLVILVLAVVAVIVLLKTQKDVSRKREEAAALSEAVTAAEQKNAQLREDIAGLDTDEGKEAVARNELGLTDAGEIIFKDVGN